MENFGYLINDCARLLRRNFDEKVRPLGVTVQQARLLLNIERNEGDQQGSYAALLEVEPITLCRIVDRMQEAGLIRREPDPDDRRARRLYLTPKARDMTRELTARVLNTTDEVGIALTPEELAGLVASLGKVRARLLELREQGAAVNG